MLQMPHSTGSKRNIASAPSAKWRNLNAANTSRHGEGASGSRCGSGMSARRITTKPKTKKTSAAACTGRASRTFAFATACPMRKPRTSGEVMPPRELNVQPYCTRRFPPFPPPPSVLRSGFAVVFSMHIDSPATNAPATYTAKDAANPESSWSATPRIPTDTAASDVNLYPRRFSTMPHGSPMKR